MQILHKFVPSTSREKTLVLLFSVASSIVTATLMTQEWFSGYRKASKPAQAESPPLVLGDPIYFDSIGKSSQQEPEVEPPAIVTGGRSPSEYDVSMDYGLQHQSVSSLSQVGTSRKDIAIFGTCNSGDLGKIENGAWYWHDMGHAYLPGKGWVYGGSYVTSNERINKSDYGKGIGYLMTTTYRLKRTNGTWVNKIYLPMTIVDSVCQ